MNCLRFVAFLAFCLVTLPAGAPNPVSQLWSELKAKRDALASYHQEFAVDQVNKAVGHDDQTFTRRVSIDVAHAMWRERSVSGSGDYVTISNGAGVFRMEADGAEYVRIKAKSKAPDPLPVPYGLADADWSKAVEVRRGSCGLQGSDHQCVLVEAPVKPTVNLGSNSQLKMMEGHTRMAIDLETGLLISSRTVQLFQNQGGTIYRSDITFKLKSMEYGKSVDAKLFSLPDGMREVHELGGWDAGRIKKQLAGKPAPDLGAIDNGELRNGQARCQIPLLLLPGEDLSCDERQAGYASYRLCYLSRTIPTTARVLGGVQSGT